MKERVYVGVKMIFRVELEGIGGGEDGVIVRSRSSSGLEGDISRDELVGGCGVHRGREWS